VKVCSAIGVLFVHSGLFGGWGFQRCISRNVWDTVGGDITLVVDGEIIFVLIMALFDAPSVVSDDTVLDMKFGV
jgi:hypothetical protein